MELNATLNLSLLEKLERLLVLLQKEIGFKDVYIAGDFNVDVMSKLHVVFHNKEIIFLFFVCFA